MNTTPTAEPMIGTCPVCGHVGPLIDVPYEGKVYRECADAAGCWDRWIALRKRD